MWCICRLEILENEVTGSGDRIALGLYIASAAGRSDLGCREQIERLIAASVPVVPLIEAGAAFSDGVPDSPPDQCA